MMTLKGISLIFCLKMGNFKADVKIDMLIFVLHYMHL